MDLAQSFARLRQTNIRVSEELLQQLLDEHARRMRHLPGRSGVPECFLRSQVGYLPRVTTRVVVAASDLLEISRQTPEGSINFNVALIKDGIARIVTGLQE